VHVKPTKRWYRKLKTAFPEEEGFRLTVTKWQIIGEFVDLENAVK
jgi:hypothetical protein